LMPLHRLIMVLQSSDASCVPQLPNSSFFLPFGDVH
jgi:hypothetical protein